MVLNRMLLKKVLLILGCIIFFLFAALQINDASQYGNADAWVWIIIYGAMATINLLMLWFSIAKHWLFCWCGFIWGALLFRLQDAQGNLHLDWLHPSNYWDSSNGDGATMVQHANESGGLLIVGLWACLTCYLAGVKSTDTRRSI